MGDFNKAVTFTLSKEGVFSNDKADAGGRTKFGITEAELIAQQKAGRFAGRRIEDLTKDEATQIYRANYWRYDGVVSDLIATKLFDIGVNMGLQAAVRIAQYAINFAGNGQHVDVDGQWGARTLTALNVLAMLDSLKLYKAMTLYQAQRYVDIVLGNHSQLVFIDGWIARAGSRPPS